MMHDFAVTDQHAVFFDAPAVFDLASSDDRVVVDACRLPRMDIGLEHEGGTADANAWLHRYTIDVAANHVRLPQQLVARISLRRRPNTGRQAWRDPRPVHSRNSTR